MTWGIDCGYNNVRSEVTWWSSCIGYPLYRGYMQLMDHIQAMIQYNRFISTFIHNTDHVGPYL